MRKGWFLLMALLTLLPLVSAETVYDDFENNVLNTTLFNFVKTNTCDGGTAERHWNETGGKAQANCNHTSANHQLAIQVYNLKNWSLFSLNFTIDWDLGGSDVSRFLRVGWANLTNNATEQTNAIWQGDYYNTQDIIGKGSKISWVPNATGISILRNGTLVKTLAFNGTGAVPTIMVTGGSSQVTYLNISNVNYTADTIEVQLHYILNGTTTSNTTIPFSASFITNNLNLTNATLQVWYSNGSFFRQNTSVVTGMSNSTLWNIASFDVDNYRWNVLACALNSSSRTICTYAPSNFTFTIGVTFNSHTFNSTSYETSRESFISNVTLPTTSSLTGANLFYNGTIYTGTISNAGGSNYLISKSFDVPLGIGNRTWFWLLTITRSTGGSFYFNSSSQYQDVKSTTLALCNATYATQSVNFTIYNENTTTTMLTGVNFKGNFVWYLGGGTIKKNQSFSPAAGSSFTFCINPNSTFITSSSIELSKSGFTTRIYNFNKENYNNTVEAQPLYLLDSSEGRNVIVEVKDIGLAPLSNYMVDIYRIYPDVGDELIARHRTDIYGQFVERLIENTVKYRFEFRDANNTLKKSTEEVVVACRATICILPFVIEDTTNDFSRFNNLSDYEYSLNFNNDTNIFTFSWNDNRGESPTHRLLVTRYQFNGTTTVCNVTSTALSSSLSCSVGGGKASYQAQAFRITNGEEIRIDTKGATVGSDYSKFGKEGLLWSFLLLMTLITVGIWNPPVGIGLYLGGFIILGALNIIFINPAIIIAELVIGVVFIWAFRS